MSRGVSKELNVEIRRVLEEAVESKPGSKAIVRQLYEVIGNDSLGNDPLRNLAIEYLIDRKVFEPRPITPGLQGETIRVTAYGREYWEKISTPTPVYWFKQNWLPAIVALATIVAALANFVS